MTTSDEARLIERAKQGDVEAFGSLIGQYERKVYNLAYRLTGHPEDAAEMAQEAFVRVFTQLGQFHGDSSFATWLFRITSNVCLDELRRRKRRLTFSIDETVAGEEGEMARQFADPGDGPEQALTRQEAQLAVRKAIAALDEEHQTVLVLRYFQNLPYEQIRDILNCSLGTVKSRLNRAKHALKEKLLSAERELLSPRFVSRSRRRQGHDL